MVNKLPINWSLLWAALRDFCVTYFYYVYTWQWQWLWPRFFYSLCNKLFFILPLLIIVAFPLFYLRNDCYYIVWDERNTRGVYIVNRRVYTYKHDAASTRINLQDRMEEKNYLSFSLFFWFMLNPRQQQQPNFVLSCCDLWDVPHVFIFWMN